MCGNIICQYSVGCDYNICNTRRSFSDISKGEGDSKDDSVSWKGTDTGNYRYARGVLSEKHGYYICTVRDSGVDCGSGCGSALCVETKQPAQYRRRNCALHGADSDSFLKQSC